MSPELQQQQVDEATAKALEYSNLTAEVKQIVKIESPEQFERVVQVDALLKAGLDFFEEHHRPNIDRWHKGHKAALADLARDQKDAREGYALTGALLVTYKREQDRLRKQEQDRLDRENEEARQRQADIAKQAGLKDVAKEILKRPAEPAVAPPPLPKTPGLHFSKHKHYEVVDLGELVRAVAAGKAPIGALEYKAAFINTQTTQLFDSTKPDKNGIKWLYPGVKIWESDSPVRK